MRLIAPLARALVIAFLALAFGYLVRTFAAHGRAVGPPLTPVPSSVPSPAAAKTVAAAMNPLPAPVSAPLAPKVVGTTSAVPIEAPATAMPRSPASTAPATIAPAAMATLPASLPAYAVTSLPAPPVVVAQGPGTVMAAAHDPPQILDVNLSTREIHGGDTVFGRVRTSSNVASVEARVEGYSSSLPKVGVGEFAIAYKVPPMIPFYLQHTYSLHLIARNVDGAQATRDLSVSLR